MKTVNVTYFKNSGKYYEKTTIEIPEDLTGYEALYEEIPKHHKDITMYMMVQDSGDNKEPYIVPHLFSPKSYWE